MRLETLADNVFHLKFRTRYDLTSTFLRFQEHYESPEFRGKIFTLDEYKKWYTANSEKGKKTGKFTYYKDWCGFNIPSYILEPFYEGKFDPLSDKEEAVLDLFEDKREEKFYIIGTYRSKLLYKADLRHEAAHGLYYINHAYKSSVLKILKKIDKETREEMYNVLKEVGYHHDVCVDESHAFLIALSHTLKKKGFNTSKLKPIRKELNALFNKYCKL